MGHDVHVVIEERGHNGEYQVPVPGIRYCSVTHITHAAALTRGIIKNGGRNQGRGENTEDKQEHKPATKNPSGTGKRARGSQKSIGPTPRKAGVGGTSNQGVLNHRRDHQNHQSQQGLG